jgi:two-component system, OmpR family, alkaline phosphatase synthesis response regulator PhoP
MNNDKLIYCVEDDTNIRELVVYALNNMEFQAEGFACGEDFFKRLNLEKPALILLDIMLPGEDGLSILKKIRDNRETKNIPVILLTAKGAEYDKVQGLDAGADDFVAKPFGVMELISRIKAVLRRIQPETESRNISIGKLKIDVKQRRVYLEGREISLTYKEFELLLYLSQNENIVLTREKILDVVWGYEIDVETRTVDVHIGGLRQKLGDQGIMIETLRNVGYRMGRIQ